MSSETNSESLTHINTTVREFQKRPSPLARDMVANGFVYDMSTGLVRPHQVATERGRRQDDLGTSSP